MMYSPPPQDCWKGEGPLEGDRREGRVVTSNSGQLCTRCFSHITVLIMFQQCKMAPFQSIAAGKRRQIASESKGNNCRRDAFMRILPCLPTSVLSTVKPHWVSQAKVIIADVLCQIQTYTGVAWRCCPISFMRDCEMAHGTSISPREVEMDAYSHFPFVLLKTENKKNKEFRAVSVYNNLHEKA